MEKIKNILSGNKNETVEGTGQTTGTTTGHTGGLSGEGSHFGGAKDTTSSKQVPGAYPTKSGVGSTQQTGTSGFTGSQNTTAGPHDSNLANKVDPRVDSTTNSTTGQGYGGNSGHHSTSAANEFDPSVNTRGSKLENAEEHSAVHGGGAEQADHHHKGRDAAIGAGAVGLGEHEHYKHQQAPVMSTEATPEVGGRGGFGTDFASMAADINPDNRDHEATYHQGHHHDHHTGRDAALGAGAAGVGLHEHNKHKHENVTDTSSPQLQGGLGPAYSSNAAAINPDKRHEGSHSGQHHVGRDAAIAGGVGAAGYGAEKHHHHESGSAAAADPYDARHFGSSSDSAIAHGGVSADHPHTTGTQGQHPIGGDTQHTKDHHYGRDAAVAGGVGAAGYEAEKHHHNKHESSSAQAADPYDARNFENASDSAIAHGGYSNDHLPATGTQGQHSTVSSTEHNKDHHYGRDAAVAGGVGAAGYEAEKHHKHDKDLTKEEKAEKTEHKHELKEEKKEHKSHGISSFLHRDKNKKYTKEEQDDFDRQEHEHNSHSHAGRDAAVVGGVGAAGYGVEKHHNKNKELPTAPGNGGVGTGAGTGNALDSNTSGVHSGQLVGEHANTGTNTHAAVPLSDKPVGTDIGDKLHGVERSRGVGAGAGGAFAQHETRKNDGTGLPGTTGHVGSENIQGMSGTQQQGGVGGVGETATGEHGLHHAGGNVGDERNRLRKEPPAGHSAAGDY